MVYVYTKLKDVKSPGTFHLYGVISEVVKLHAQLKSGMRHSMINIMDESLPKNASFRLHLFLPAQCLLEIDPGSIIRVHGMKVEKWNNLLDGRVFRASDVMMFSGAPNSDFTPKPESKTAIVTAKDKARVQELRDLVVSLAKDEACVQELRETSKIGAKCDESSEEFFAVVTGSQRVTFPYSDTEDDSADKANQNVEDVNTKSNCVNVNDGAEGVKGMAWDKCLPRNPVYENCADGLSRTVEVSPCKKLFLNPFNENFKRLSQQKNLEDECRKRHGMAELCPDNERHSVLPPSDYDKAYCLENYLKRISPASDRDKVTGSGICDLFSKSVQEGSSIALSCPGLTCASIGCVQRSIILDDDDPRLNVFKDINGFKDLSTMTEGGLASQAAWEELRLFYQAKVKIINIKPNLKRLLKTPKDMLSGKCRKCGTYTIYTSLKWKMDQGLRTKKPMCPDCFEDGHEQFVSLQYRIELTVTDTSGSNMDIFALLNNASTFLGFTPSEFIGCEANQTKISETLARVIPSKDFIRIRFFLVQKPNRVISCICNTKLKDICH